MTDLTKKLSMKKTFFVTQLESFFNTITQEFQEKLQSIEVENKVLKEKNKKLEYDVNNLVEIKNKLLEEIRIIKKSSETISEELRNTKSMNSDEYNLELIRKNNKLKKQIKTLTEELENIKKNTISKQSTLSRGAVAYNQNLMQKKNEEIIREITKSLKK